MINTKTELQYQIALGILMRMKAAGFVTEDEAERKIPPCSCSGIVLDITRKAW